MKAIQVRGIKDMWSVLHVIYSIESFFQKHRLDHNNMAQSIAAVASKVTGVAATATAGLAVTLDVPKLLGYTVEEWQIIGIITGMVVGFGGLFITTLFHFLNYRLNLKKSRVDDVDGG